jgi:hypothetical protein
MRLASTTVPWAANASCRSFSVVLKERFPTNNFVLIFDDLLFKTNRFSRLFPTIGFQIITEPSSLEDSPCSEITSYFTDESILPGSPAVASKIFNASGRSRRCGRVLGKKKRPEFPPASQRELGA